MAYPQYRSGTTVFSSDPKNFTCHICPEKTQRDIEEHLQQQAHSLKYTFFVQWFEDRGFPFVMCKLCEKWLLLEEIIDHVNIHKFFPWHGLSRFKLPAEKEKRLDDCVLSAKNCELYTDNKEPTEPDDNSDDESEIIFCFCRICNTEVNINDIQSHRDYHKQKSIIEVNDKSDSVVVPFIRDICTIQDNLKAIRASLDDLTIRDDNKNVVTSEASEMVQKVNDLMKNGMAKLNGESTVSENTTLASEPSNKSNPDNNNSKTTPLTVTNNMVRTFVSDLMLEGKYQQRRRSGHSKINGLARQLDDFFESKITYGQIPKKKIHHRNDHSKNITNGKDNNNDNNTTKCTAEGSVGGEKIPSSCAKLEGDNNKIVASSKPITMATSVHNTAASKQSSQSKHTINEIVQNPKAGMIKVESFLDCETRNTKGYVSYQGTISHETSKKLTKQYQTFGKSPIEIYKGENFSGSRSVPEKDRVQCRKTTLTRDNKPITTLIDKLEISDAKTSATTSSNTKLSTSLLINENNESDLVDRKNSTVANENSKSSILSSEDNSDELHLPVGFIKKQNSLFCEPCNVKFAEYQTVIDHSKASSHKKRLDVFSKGIVRINNILYKCTFCKSTLKNLSDAEEHLKSIDHKKNAGSNAEDIKFGETLIDKIDEKPNDDLNLPNGFKRKGKVVFCTICKIEVGASQNVIQHSNTRQHKIYQDALKQGISRMSKKANRCKLCKCIVMELSGVEEHLKSDQHKINSGELPADSPSRTTFINESSRELCNNEDLPDGFIKKESAFFCEPCDIEFLSYEPAVNHSKSSSHRKRLNLFPKGIIRIDKTSHKCIICDCTLTNFSEAEKHLEANEHKRKAGLPAEDVNSSKTPINEINEKINDEVELPNGFIQKGKCLFCTICEIKVGAYQNAIEHSNTRQHQTYQSALNNGISWISKREAKCNFCNCILIGLDEVEKHLTSVQHKRNSIFATNNGHGNKKHKEKYNDTIDSMKGAINKGKALFSTICKSDGDQRQNVLEHSNIKQQEINNDASNEIIIHISKKQSKCKICDCIVIGRRGIEQHLKSIQHRKMLELSPIRQADVDVCRNVIEDVNVKQQEIDNDASNGIPIQISRKQSKCKICNCIVIGLRGVEEHLKSIRHKKILLNSDKEKFNNKLGLLQIFEKKESPSVYDPYDVDFPKFGTDIDNCKSISHKKSVDIPSKNTAKHLANVEHTEHARLLTRSTHSNTTPKEETDKESTDELHLPDGFTKKRKSLFCTICKVDVGAYQNVVEHSNSRQHRIHYEASIRGMIRVSKKESYCNFCNCNVVGTDEIQEHFESMQHDRNSEVATLSIDSTKICTNEIREEFNDETGVPGEFIKEESAIVSESCDNDSSQLFLESTEKQMEIAEHQKKSRLTHKSITLSITSINEIDEEPIVDLDLPNGFKKKGKGVSCTICNIEVGGYQNVIEHSNTKQHKIYHDALNEGIIRVSKKESKCKFCNCTMIELDEIEAHVRTVQHTKNLQLSNENLRSRNTTTKESNDESNNELNLLDGFTKKGSASFCHSCNINFHLLEDAIDHSNSIQHKKMLHAFQKDIIRIDEKWHKCVICTCTINGLDEVEKHLESDQHRYKINPNSHNEKPTLNVNHDRSIERRTYASTLSLFSQSDQDRNEIHPSIHREKSALIHKGGSTGSSTHTSTSSLSSVATSFSEVSSQFNHVPSNNTFGSSSKHDEFPVERKYTEVTATALPQIKEQYYINKQPLQNEQLNGVRIPFVKCSICRWVVLGDFANIFRHITSENHKLKLQSVVTSSSATFTNLNHARFFKMESYVDRNTYLIKVLALPLDNVNTVKKCFFWCNMCENVFDDEPSVHLHSISHLQILHGIKILIGSYYLTCRTCNNTSFISPNAIMDHINEPSHQKNILGATTNINLQSIKSCFSRNPLPDGIQTIVDDFLFLCTTCNCRINSTENLEKHVNEPSHKMNGRAVILKLRKMLFTCLVCFGLFPNLISIEEHLNDQTHKKKCIFMHQLDPINIAADLLKPIRVYQLNEYTCSICNVRLEGDLMVALEHSLHQRHQSIITNKSVQRGQETNMSEIIEKSSEISPLQKSINIRSTPTPRLICEFKVNPEDSATPTSANSNRIEEQPRVILSNSTQSVCNICNIIIPGSHWNLMAHRETKLHQKNEDELSSLSRTSVAQVARSDGEKNHPSPLQKIPHQEMVNYSGINVKFIECKVCKIHIRADPGMSVHQSFDKHLKSKEHWLKKAESIRNWNSTFSLAKTPYNTTKFNKLQNKPPLSCHFCSEKVTDSFKLHAHMTSHFWPMFLINFDKNADRSSTIEDEASNMQDEILEDELEMSETLNNVEPIEKVKEPQQKPQSPNWRSRPLDIDLDDGLNIYEVHHQKKDDLELGVLLTFAFDEHFYCLVCRKAIKKSVQILYDHLCSINHLAFLQEMIEDQREFKNYPHELSDLSLAYQYMEEVDDESVKCYACEISLKNDTSSLRNHIKDACHNKHWATLAANAKTWFDALSSRMYSNFYTVKNYWCVPCKLKFPIEVDFRRHLNSKKHLRKTEKFTTIGELLIFDYCAVCAALWCGFLKTFGYHSKCAMHKHYTSQGFYLITKLPPSAERLLHSPGRNVDKLVEKIDSVQAECVQKERALIHDLERICREKYQSIVAHPFGSRVTRLGGSHSDFDIFVDCSTKKYPVYEGRNSSVKKIQERLKIIKSCLEENPKVWLINCEILEARTPIIKARHLPTAIECDFSFTNGLTVESTKLVKSYCEKFPTCRKMIIFIRNWMGHCDLTGLNGIHSCAVSWMVIFFLQQKGFFLSVHELIAKKKQTRLIGGWETGVDLDFDVIDSAEQIENLLSQFFAFYANFDYRNEVICPLLGKSVKKTVFQKSAQLPTEMKTYRQYLECGQNTETFRNDSVLCIQDPFDLSHNVTKAVKKCVVYRLKSFCSLSAIILENY